MKVFEVTVHVQLKPDSVLGYWTPTSHKKVFASEGKADEYYKKVYDAAAFLGISGHVVASITPLELE